MTWFVDKLGPRSTDVTAQNTGRATSLAAGSKLKPAAGKAAPAPAPQQAKAQTQAPAPQASGGDEKKKKKGWF